MENILGLHFDAIRERLTSEGRLAQSFSHNTNKGNIRETFARELLDGSTSKFTSIGSGEIIHKEMAKEEKRPQTDVIVYNNRYPKITGAGGVDLFFVETVSSIVEVKSKLTKADVRQAAKASKLIKSYPYAPPHRFNATGMVKTPRPYSFLFAYDTAASDIKTVAKWMQEVAEEDDYRLKELCEADFASRNFFPHLFLDGVFVLNKGYVCIDAMPFQSPCVAQPDIPKDHIWLFGDQAELEYLWAAVNLAGEALFWNELDLGAYLPVRMMQVSNAE